MDKNGIKITPTESGWKATWFGECVTYEECIDENPIEALKLLLESKKVRNPKESINTLLKSQVEDILSRYAKARPHHKAIINTMEVNAAIDDITDSHYISIGVAVYHRFITPGRMISDYEFIKHQTNNSIYRILQHFNTIFSSCMKDSNTMAQIGPFSVATNTLLPKDILYVHPQTYHELLRLVRDTKIKVSLYHRD